MDAEIPPVSPASSSSVPTSPGGPNSEVLKMVARVLRNMEGVTSKNSERLRFLDPELKSTQSRIEVLEILCRANEDKISQMSTDLSSVHTHNDTKESRRNDEVYGKEIRTNNYFHTSRVKETKETSRTERLSSKETNTKYIIEKNSDVDNTKDGDTQTPSEDKPTPLRPNFRSHDNIMTCCLSPAEDEVFLLDNRIRKHDSEPFMVHASDPKTSNFMKRLWGYEDVPEQKTNVTMHKFPSHLTIDHEPTEDCYLYCSKMADNLWKHALDTLENYKDPDGGADISLLYHYEEQDTTGILKRHKTLVNNVTSEPKTMYFELIKMLMDFEKQHSDQKAYQEIQSISKIQGYQDLTNRLHRNIIEKLFVELQSVQEQLSYVQKIMGVNSDSFVWDQQPWAEKLANMESALVEHNDRFNGVESENNRQNEDIADLYDKLKIKDDQDDKGRSMQEEQVILQSKTLQVLEGRIDANEEHIDLLEKHDMEQDAKIEDLTEAWGNMENKFPALEKHDMEQDVKIEDLTEAWGNMENKFTALESADTYIQESHKLLVGKVEGIEEDVQRKEYKETVDNLKDDFQTYQETKDINDEKTMGMIEVLKECEVKLTDGVDELKKDNVEIKEKLAELDGNTKNLEEKAEELLMEIEKAKDTYKSLQTDQTDGISGANDRLARLDELIIKLTGDLDEIKEQSKNTADEIKVLHDENEKHKGELTIIENEAATFQEKVYITINDNRNDADETLKRVDELVVDVKTNTEKIEALDKDNNNLIERIGSLEINVNSNELGDEIKRLENEIKGNSSKIEDGNVIIKRHSEQLYLIEPMAQDTAEKVDEIEGKLKTFEKEQNDQDQKISSIEIDLGNKQIAIDDLYKEKDKLWSKLEDVDENTKFNLRKIEGLEEQHQGELEEKATYVQRLESKVVTISEQAQKNEDKFKEDLDATVEENKSILDELKAQYKELEQTSNTHTTQIDGLLNDGTPYDNKHKIDELRVIIDTQYHELTEKSNTHTNDIEGLWDNNKNVETGLKTLTDCDEELKQKILAIQTAKDELARRLEEAIDGQQYSLEALQNHVHRVDEMGKDTKDKVENLEPSIKEHGFSIIRIEEQVGSIPEQINIVKNELHLELETHKGAIDQLRQDLEKDITNLEEKIRGILESLSELDKDDINELMKARKDLDEKLQELENKMKEVGDVTSNTLTVNILELKNDNERALQELERKIDVNIKDLAGELEDELKTAKENLETTQNMLITTIDGVKIDNERAIGEVEVKLNDAVLELYNKDIHGIKEDLDSVKGETKKNESELENVSSLVQNVQINIGEVRTQAHDADLVTKEQIRTLRTETEENKKDLWKMILEVYGALRGYTVILSSTGSAAEHQMTCLGVYRMAGDYNGKPLYKQDEGENYLYYQNKTWLVGPKLGVSHAGAHSGQDSTWFSDYAWMKLDGGKSDGASSSEESGSSSSDSDAEEGDQKVREKKLRVKRTSMGIFREGWKYKSALMGIELSSHSEDSDDSVHWVGDDTTLKVEALKDIQMIGEVIEDIKRSKQID